MGHGGSACAMWRWPRVGGAGRLDEPDAEISSPGRPAATPRSHHFVAGRGAGRAVCAGAGPGVVGLAPGRGMGRTQHAHLRKKQINAAARTHTHAITDHRGVITRPPRTRWTHMI